MKKKLLVVGALSLAAFTAVGVAATMATSGSILFADTSTSSKHLWMHYAKKAATKTEKGIREYWANCNTHEIVYEKPGATDIGESTTYDTTGFAADDGRWIYNVTLDAKEVVMTDATKAFDLGTDYSGATITSMKAGAISLGTDASALDVSGFAEDHSDDGVKSVEVELNKDGKYYTLFFDTTFVTAKISTVTDFKSYIVPESGVNKFGYYQMGGNITMTGQNSYCSGNSSQDYFAGTLDGKGYTITQASNGQYGLFGNLRNATIKNLNIADNWYNGQHNCVLLGKFVYQSTLENVSTKVTAASSAASNPECYAPIAGTGSVGYLVNNTFQSNILKDCTFDLSGYKVGSLFGWNTSMTVPTVTNTVVKAASLVQAMCSLYTGKTYQPENVTLKDGEVAISGLTLTLDEA